MRVKFDYFFTNFFSLLQWSTYNRIKCDNHCNLHHCSWSVHVLIRIRFTFTSCDFLTFYWVQLGPREVLTYYLLSLSVADLLAGILVVPLSVYPTRKHCYIISKYNISSLVCIQMILFFQIVIKAWMYGEILW